MLAVVKRCAMIVLGDFLTLNFFSIDCIPCFVARGKLGLRLFFSCFLDKSLKAWYNGGASSI